MYNKCVSDSEDDADEHKGDKEEGENRTIKGFEVHKGLMENIASPASRACTL
jgi:hypothetical protein